MKKECPKCKITKESSAFNKSRDRKDGLQVHCKDCRKRYAQSSKKYQREYRKKNAIKIREYQKKWITKNKDKRKIISQKYRDRLRKESFDYYGNKCECCGEKLKDFLVIDHINGGGVKHRKLLKGGSAIYKWLKDNNYPIGYRVLCHNCNWSVYRNNGICVHGKQE